MNDDEQRRHEELMAQLRRNNAPRPTDLLASIIIGGAVIWLAVVLFGALLTLLLFGAMFIKPLLAFAALVGLPIWLIHQISKERRRRR